MVPSNMVIDEEEVTKMILEFLKKRDLCISMMAVEREVGLVNGTFSKDLLFLRQLIMDGQWDDAIVFIEPISKEFDNFDTKLFQKHILKHKYFELLCIKSQPGAFMNFEVVVNETIVCMQRLEQLHDSRDHADILHLKKLLDLPHLTDDPEYLDWNPSKSRVKCFNDIYPLIEPFAKSKEQPSESRNDRLMQLIVKGLLYESCVSVCQSRATNQTNSIVNYSTLLGGSPASPDLIMLSWLKAIPAKTFNADFDKKEFRVDTRRIHSAPLDVTSWTDHIMSVSVKPKVFPHSAIQPARPRSANHLITRSLNPQYDGLTSGLLGNSLTGDEAIKKSLVGAHHNETPGARGSPALNRSVNKLFSSSQRLLTRSSLVFGDPATSNTDEPFVTSKLSDDDDVDVLDDLDNNKSMTEYKPYSMVFTPGIPANSKSGKVLNTRASSVDCCTPITHSVSPMPVNTCHDPPVLRPHSTLLDKTPVKNSTASGGQRRFDADVSLPEDLPLDARLLTPVKSPQHKRPIDVDYRDDQYAMNIASDLNTLHCPSSPISSVLSSPAISTTTPTSRGTTTAVAYNTPEASSLPQRAQGHLPPDPANSSPYVGAAVGMGASSADPRLSMNSNNDIVNQSSPNLYVEYQTQRERVKKQLLAHEHKRLTLELEMLDIETRGMDAKVANDAHLFTSSSCLQEPLPASAAASHRRPTDSDVAKCSAVIGGRIDDLTRAASEQTTPSFSPHHPPHTHPHHTQVAASTPHMITGSLAPSTGGAVSQSTPQMSKAPNRSRHVTYSARAGHQASLTAEPPAPATPHHVHGDHRLSEDAENHPSPGLRAYVTPSSADSVKSSYPIAESPHVASTTPNLTPHLVNPTPRQDHLADSPLHRQNTTSAKISPRPVSNPDFRSTMVRSGPYGNSSPDQPPDNDLRLSSNCSLPDPSGASPGLQDSRHASVASKADHRQKHPFDDQREQSFLKPDTPTSSLRSTPVSRVNEHASRNRARPLSMPVIESWYEPGSDISTAYDPSTRHTSSANTPHAHQHAHQRDNPHLRTPVSHDNANNKKLTQFDIVMPSPLPGECINKGMLNKAHNDSSLNVTEPHLNLSSQVTPRTETKSIGEFEKLSYFKDINVLRCIDFHPSGDLFVTGSNTSRLRICRFPEEKSCTSLEICDILTDVHKGSIYSVAWSPCGQLIASASNDNQVKIQRYNEHRVKFTDTLFNFSHHTGIVRDCCFAPSQMSSVCTLLSGGAGCFSTFATDCRTGALVNRMTGHTGCIQSLHSWTPRMFISGSVDKTARVWDLRMSNSVAIVNSTNCFSSVCVDRTGAVLATGHDNGSIALWDIRSTFTPLQKFYPHKADVRSVKFSEDSCYLMSSSFDHTIALTDVTGDLLKLLTTVKIASHNDKVIQAIWRPRGQCSTDSEADSLNFVSTGSDRKVICWRLQ